MKLLLDENLSDRIVAQIVDLFPDSTHVKSEGLIHTDDSLIADWAKQRGFIDVIRISELATLEIGGAVCAD